MSTGDHADPVFGASPSHLVDVLEAAEFIQFIARRDGDALAATGLLLAACRALDIPFHASSVRTRSGFTDQLAGVDESADVVVLGIPPDSPDYEHESASLRAYNAVQLLGQTPDPIFALAGILAGDTLPRDLPPALIDDAGLSRSPGLSIPTTDLADGLVHTTLAHTEYSANPERTETILGELESTDAQYEKRVASLLAIAATNQDPANAPRASTAIDQAVNPYTIDGPFETLGGYADVLTALAPNRPGIALTLPVMTDHNSALDVWRSHATNTHAAIETASTTERDIILIATLDHGPVGPAARLIRDYESPAPTVIATTDTEVGIATTDLSLMPPVEDAATLVDGSALTHGTMGYAQIPAGTRDAFLDHLTSQ